MRILVVLSRVPWPLEKGDKLRAYYLMRELSKQHEIILFCLTDKKVHPLAEQKLKEFCTEIFIYRINLWGRLWRLFKSLFSNKPFQVNYFYSSKAQLAFDQYLSEHLPQHIFCQLIRTAEFVRKYSMIPKSMDYMDALGVGMQKMATASKWPLKPLMTSEFGRLIEYEKSIANLFQKHIVISPQDREQIEIDNKIEIIPNGVGEHFFNSIRREKSIDILFSGNMNYRPNVESAKYLIKEIMPLVWDKNPSVNVCIAGANPSSQVLNLQSSMVTVTGWVDDISAVFQKSKLFVAPMLINSGMQNKILEAMASKVPCITTPLANNAIMAKQDESIILGDTATEISQHILRLLPDLEMRESIAEKAYSFVKETYSWHGSASLLQGVIEESNLTAFSKSNI